MNYVVLARKWRPMTFADLVGQEHVGRTLGNAIATGRVAHAFLFTGVRGVGKTTSARILARALNCLGDPDSPTRLDGPTATPCLRCDACLEITAGTDLDVQEIDGASNNGVDEVRKLQDSLPYRPGRDRYKIFIIDEVHMLSQSAWNAFLKTLEEPPPHVKFIFATTEVHKVPVTILSRVQRFDFKLIRAAQIAERLRFVLKEEGIASDDPSVALLAREAAGSMRDAMSLLDQVIAASAGALRGEELAQILGVASSRVLFDLTRAVLDRESDTALRVVAQLAENGYDVTHVARDVLGTLRNVVVARVSKDPGPLLDVTKEETDDLCALAQGRDTDDLLRVHQGFSRAFDDIVRSRTPRAALEMGLLRLAQRPQMLPIDDLIGRLAELERRLGGTAPSGGNRPAPSGAPNRPGTPSAGNPPTSVAAPSEPSPAAPPRAPAAPPRAPAPPVAAPSVATVRAREEEAPTREEAAAPAPASTPPAIVTPPKEESDTLRRWQRVVTHVRTTDPQLASIFNHGIVHAIDGQELHVSFEQGTVFEEQASAPRALELLGRALAQEFEKSPKIRLSTHRGAGSAPTLADIASQERETAKNEAIERARQHPLVLTAAEVLGAKVKDIRLPTD